MDRLWNACYENYNFVFDEPLLRIFCEKEERKHIPSLASVFDEQAGSAKAELARASQATVLSALWDEAQRLTGRGKDLTGEHMVCQATAMKSLNPETGDSFSWDDLSRAYQIMVVWVNKNRDVNSENLKREGKLPKITYNTNEKEEIEEMERYLKEEVPISMQW